MDQIFPNESLDMRCEDQKSYVNDDFCLNEVVEYDEALYAVIKTHKLWSNKIYNSKLTISKI